MDIPINGTYSVPVGGPSPHLVMLRAVLLKAAGIARNAWHGTRTTLRLAGQLPRSAAVTVASMLATNAGYTALTGTAARARTGRAGNHAAAAIPAVKCELPFGLKRNRLNS